MAVFDFMLRAPVWRFESSRYSKPKKSNKNEHKETLSQRELPEPDKDGIH